MFVVSLALTAVLTSGAAVAPPSPAPFPVLLVHGFFGWRSLGIVGEHFGPTREALEEAGATVFVPCLPPVASIEDRAHALGLAIDEALWRTGAAKVHIIAHSQGGVDARYALGVLGFAPKVASLVTLASPHHGTPIASWGLRAWPDVVVDGVFRASHAFLESEQGISPRRSEPLEVLAELSVDGMRAQNRLIPDTDVPTFSVASFTGSLDDDSCEGGLWQAPRGRDIPGPFPAIGWAVLRQHARAPVPNDGVVPAKSARHGTFLGCIAIDHIDWLGMAPSLSTSDTWTFDAPAFFVELYLAQAALEQSGTRDAFIAHVPSLADLADAELDPSHRLAIEVPRLAAQRDDNLLR